MYYYRYSKDPSYYHYRKRCETSKRHNNPRVITSYSIHYTKLYENIKDIIIFNILVPLGRVIITTVFSYSGIKALTVIYYCGIQGWEKDISFVITSYSIHYTKLYEEQSFCIAVPWPPQVTCELLDEQEAFGEVRLNINIFPHRNLVRLTHGHLLSFKYTGILSSYNFV